MDRTVPKIGSEEIQLYARTYYSLLRSSHLIQIEALVETHMAMESSLHVLARDPKPDIAALTYSSLRLPPCIIDVNRVLLGQMERSFTEAGHPVMQWERVFSVGRRRRTHFDGDKTLAVFIASRSDIDDLIPMLTAYQIEWNKLHTLLQGDVISLLSLRQQQDRTSTMTDSDLNLIANKLEVDKADLRRLETVWGENFFPTFMRMSKARKQFGVQMIAGSLSDYRRGTASWWDDLRERMRHEVDIEDRPVYFVSSNTHSLVNMVTGFALREAPNLIQYVNDRGHEDLRREYQGMVDEGASIGNRSNFFYYTLKKYLAESDASARQRLKDEEREVGIHRLVSRHGFDIETQIIELNKLRPGWLDPRLMMNGTGDWLANSDAILINIDYPLGLGAYEILARLTERAAHLLGIYIIGKAATLNARIGDVMISNVVYDEHSENTYLFNNCFTANDIAPYLTYGTVLDNQKAISARGTFLQNARFMSVFYHEGYTVLEMEAGPYLSAIYEAVRPTRHPQNEIVNLYGAPFEIGFLHYASDTPFTKGKNLGSNLSYAGVDPTYATGVATLQRIFGREAARVRARLTPIGAMEPLLIADGEAG